MDAVKTAEEKGSGQDEGIRKQKYAPGAGHDAGPGRGSHGEFCADG